MKLHFEPDLDYQREAIEAVCALFRGQETGRAALEVRPNAAAGAPLRLTGRGLGCGNRLALRDAELLRNLQDVQLRNGLAPAEALVSPDFTVEMETGTGKTYVYLRTIFELNRRFGFTKFVIVVPSLAIKEGVHKALELTADHFRGLYAGTPFESFLYDSAKLGQVRSFATSATIQVMVVTVGAINKKDVNNLYKESEKTGGERPIDLIRATRPIVVVDEPQSVDGGLSGAGRQALAAMDPLCTLRYSATHVDEHHMVYRLDAVDAWERQLVKQIEVAAPAGDAATGPLPRQLIRRTIEEHLEKERRLRPRGVKVLSLFFVDAVEKYRRYDAAGNPVKGEYARIFEEELGRLLQRPEHAAPFEGGEELARAVAAAHGGYFSVDRRTVGGRTVERYRDTRGDTKADDDTYALIMRDKERLLSLETPLRFIFSHSALREGWDNPNVFQICSLRDICTERERRQTIGRGLRLCVNQAGERLRGFEVNTLTVIATERYEDFAANLQKEIEQDTGLRFGVVAPHQFAAVPVRDADGRPRPLGLAASEAIAAHLRGGGLLDARGRVRGALLQAALAAGAVPLPADYEPQRAAITAVLRKLAGPLGVRNADERRRAGGAGGAGAAPGHVAELAALWERVAEQAPITFRVRFDNEQLVARCSEALRAAPPFAAPLVAWRKAALAIGRDGIQAAARAPDGPDGAAAVPDGGPGDADAALPPELPPELPPQLPDELAGLPDELAGLPDELAGLPPGLPDVLAELQERTGLTRRSIRRILESSGRLADLAASPRAFVDRAADAIDGGKRRALGPGVRFRPLPAGADDDGGAGYAQELFDPAELSAALAARRGRRAPGEDGGAVRVFAELPAWFRVPTPLGDFHPDWAVHLGAGAGERLYFGDERASGLTAADLRAAAPGEGRR